MNSSIIDSDWVGRVIDGRFSLLQWLGSSGRGGVFFTELDGNPQRKAAIKLIPADESSAQARIRVWASTESVSHPRLMRVFHTGSWRIGSNLFLYAVTEYAEQNLAQILPERPLTPSETREMLEPVLDALGYLHKSGFVHGHLKPSNIMVVDDELKVSSESLQVAGQPLGIVASPGVYDAPESAAGPITPSADIWSLGVLLVETLTQHPPVWERSTHQEPVVPESIPQPFAAIARECLRIDPRRRCTIGEIKARLESPQSKPESAKKTSSTAPAKQRLMALVAAALVLILVVSAFLLRSHPTRPSLPPPRPCDLLEGSAITIECRRLARELLPTLDRYIHVTRIDLDAAADAAAALGCHQGAPASQERVVATRARTGVIQNRATHDLDGLLRGVTGGLVLPNRSPSERI